MDEEIPYQYRYVATEATSREMARAFVDHLFRRRQAWLFLAAILLVFAAILLIGMDTSFSLGARIGWSLLFAVVPTVVLALAIALLSYVRTLKAARTRIFDGAVIESGFGSEELVLRNPVASSRIQYRAIRSVTARGHQVFLRQHGVPLVAVFPRSLFPDEAIARISSARS